MIWALFRGAVTYTWQQSFFTQSGQTGFELVVDGAAAVAKGRVGVTADEHAWLANHGAVQAGGDFPVAVPAAIVIQRPGKSRATVFIDIIVERPLFSQGGRILGSVNVSRMDLPGSTNKRHRSLPLASPEME